MAPRPPGRPSTLGLMDRQQAAAEQLRTAERAAAALDAARAPRIDDWLGPASRAADATLDELDADLRRLRAAASDWLRAARRAVAGG